MFFCNFLFFNSIADIANKNIPCKFAINNESFQKKKYVKYKFFYIKNI